MFSVSDRYQTGIRRKQVTKNQHERTPLYPTKQLLVVYDFLASGRETTKKINVI